MKKGKGSKMRASWQNTQKSKKIGIIIGGAALFAFIAIGGFALFNDSENDKAAIPSTNAAMSYSLFWSDEFNGTAVDTTRWGVYHNNYGSGNNELECNTPNNVAVANGSLVITGKKQTYACPGAGTYQYTSAFLGSRDASTKRYYPLYGKYEMRARIPHGQGLWPAFWLRHNAGSSAAEVDILEEFHNQAPGKVTSTLHFPNTLGSNIAKKTVPLETAVQGTGGWHTYAVQIEPAGTNAVKFTFFVDGVESFNYTNTNASSWVNGYANNAWDIAVNMAIGGNYVGHPEQQLGYLPYKNVCGLTYKAPTNNDPTTCPTTGIFLSGLSQKNAVYEVDYVRVYTPGTTTNPPPTGDTTAPAVTVTAPAASSVLKGTVTTTATATDAVGVTKAELLVNNALKQTITGAGPFTGTVDTTTLANNSTVTITWKAYDAAGNVGTKAITTTVSNTTTTTDTTPPSAPANVVVDPIDVTPGVPIVVKWNSSTDNVGVAKYLVTRDGAYEVGTVTTTSFSDTTADKTTCTTYCHTYIIYALDAAGNKSVASAKAVGVVKDMVAPTAPTGLTSPDQTTTSVNLSWSAATDAVGVTGYKVYRNGVQVGTSTTTSFSSTSLTANTAYSFAVSAVDAVGNESVKSNVLTVSTKPLPDTTAPTAPATATATVNSATKVTVNWAAATDNVGVTKYYVQRNGVTLAQVNAPTVSYIDTTVQPSSQYTYTIKAADLAGNISAASPVATATTPALPDTTAPSSPSALAVTLVTSSQVNISWTAATDNVGVAYYKVARNGAQLANSTTTNFGDATVQPGTQYTYTVTAFDAAGNASAAATITVTTSLAAAQGLSGVTAAYYAGTELSGNPALTRNESTINNSWGSGSPSASVPTNKFSARWVGSVTPVSSGQYTFYTSSDDGVRLWVNGQQIINNWTDHGVKENIGTISLTAGVKYDIKMEYYENAGQAVAQLSWSGPGVTKAIVPNSALKTDVSGLTANYYAGTTPSGTPLVTRIDGTVNFNWASASPDVKVPADDFSAQWSGKVVIPTTGQYTFYTNADDGARLWVNGRQLVNDWTEHWPTENSGVIQLEGGKEYPIRYEYYEKSGLSTSQLLWQGPGISKAVIPVSSLRSQ